MEKMTHKHIYSLSQGQESYKELETETYRIENSSPPQTDPRPGIIDEIRAYGIDFGSTGREITKDCVLKPLVLGLGHL